MLMQTPHSVSLGGATTKVSFRIGLPGYRSFSPPFKNRAFGVVGCYWKEGGSSFIPTAALAGHLAETKLREVAASVG